MLQIPSPNYGGARGAVIWVIIHTAEGARDVRSLGNFFASTSAQASSHVGIDDSEIAQYVPYDQVAWTALEANPYADQAELCGFAAWSRQEWLSHDGMLTNTARWVADRCKARGIPPQRVSPSLVAARRPGVIGHIDVTNAFYGGSGHTDPGPGFPWDVVLDRASAILNGQEDELQADERAALFEIQKRIRGGDPNLDMPQMTLWNVQAILKLLKGNHTDANDRLTDQWLLTQQVLAAVKAIPGGTADPKALAAAIAEALPAGQAQAVVDELLKRLQAAK